ESGKGVVGKLVYDDQFAEQLTTSLTSSANSLAAITGRVQKDFDSGTGALPALISDPEGKKKVYDLVQNLQTTSANLAAFSASMKEGQGLVPRLLNDKQYGDQALNEFQGLVGQLNEAVKKINTGEGTAGKIINDPTVYESINDILIGINESKMLRWLIRNRQQSGIQKRYNEEQKAVPATTEPPPPAVPNPPVGGDGTSQSPATPPPVTTTTTTTSTAPPPY